MVFLLPLDGGDGGGGGGCGCGGGIGCLVLWCHYFLSWGYATRWNPGCSFCYMPYAYLLGAWKLVDLLDTLGTK